MTVTSRLAFLDLAAGRPGHFQLESGHHGALWLDLDALFTDAVRIAPFVTALAESIRPHGAAVVCGPLLGGAFLAQLIARELSLEFCFTERAMPSAPGGLFQTRYVLPAAFRARVAGKRVAMVDDVMSAGSALRGTYDDLRSHGALPVVAGALLQLGDTGAQYFARTSVSVEAVARDDYTVWTPSECPLCAAGVQLERPG